MRASTPRDVLLRLLYRFYERRLLRDVTRGPRPRHLGLIQDGHRRYAREAGFAAVEIAPVEHDFWRFYLLRP